MEQPKKDYLVQLQEDRDNLLKICAGQPEEIKNSLIRAATMLDKEIKTVKVLRRF